MVSVINFVSVRFSSVTHIAQYVFRFLCSLFTRFVIKNCFDDRLYGIVFREPALRAQEIFYRGVFLLFRLVLLLFLLDSVLFPPQPVLWTGAEMPCVSSIFLGETFKMYVFVCFVASAARFDTGC